MKYTVLFLGCFLTLGELAAAVPATQVVVGPDSTVYGIAYEHGIATRALIAANDLKPPYTLREGQILMIPAPNQHVMGRGETLKDIADNYGVNVDALAQENNGHALQAGESLSIPSRDTESMTEALRAPADNIATSSLAPLPTVKSAPLAGQARGPVHEPRAVPNELAEEIARERGQPAPKKQVSASKPELMGNMVKRNEGAPTATTTTARLEDDVVVEKPKKREKTVEAPKKEKPVEVAKKKEPVKEPTLLVKEIQFMKPVDFDQADILSKFSPGKNDGIKIKIPEGTGVKAAAAGDVLYAGSELKGFGNLLLIKHQDGWVTAYAHNSSLLVKKGDKVKQGQVIAKSGKTGDAKSAQLHFEVRKGKQPVDPMTKLGS